MALGRPKTIDTDGGEVAKFTIRIDSKTDAGIAQEAASRGITKGAVVREKLKEIYLGKEK
mgnify:CR=1 FL=1